MEHGNQFLIIYHEPHELVVSKPFLTIKFYEIRRIMKVFQQISK